MEEIMVSINCITYNHEKYIAKTLDGFLMQKTNFKFEVLVHDDASTDNTQSIIREYEEKYPDIIKPIYQTENQHSKGIKITRTYNYPRVKGKYIAYCEGDDYWTDENKLQKQFDVMEANKDVVICTHKVSIINESDTQVLGSIPYVPIEKTYYSQEEFYNSFIENVNLPGFQTSSFFIRSSVIKDMLVDTPEFIRIFPVGDVPLILYLATKGGLYYIPEVCSSYRTLSVSSWSRKMGNVDFKINHHKRIIEGLKKYDEYTNGEKHEFLQKKILEKEFLIYKLKNDIKKLRNKKYNFIVKKMSFKEKILHYMTLYCNFIVKYHNKRKMRKEKQA